MSLIVYEHPLSPYAQKVKIALDDPDNATELRPGLSVIATVRTRH